MADEDREFRAKYSTTPLRPPATYSGFTLTFQVGWSNEFSDDAGTNTNIEDVAAAASETSTHRHECNIPGAFPEQSGPSDTCDSAKSMEQCVTPEKATSNGCVGDLPESGAGKIDRGGSDFKLDPQIQHLPVYNIILRLQWTLKNGGKQLLDVRIGICAQNLLDDPQSVRMHELSDGDENGLAAPQIEVSFSVKGGLSYASNLYLEDSSYGPFAGMMANVRAIIDRNHTMILRGSDRAVLKRGLLQTQKGIEFARANDPFRVWYRGTSNEVQHRPNGLVPREDRPKYALTARTTYLNIEELLVVEAFGQFNDHEWEQLKAHTYHQMGARFLVTAAGDRTPGQVTEMLMLLDLSTIATAPDLQEDDEVAVHIRKLDKRGSRSDVWTGTVLGQSHLPFMHASDVPILIRAPRYKGPDGKTGVDLSPLGTLLRIEALSGGWNSDFATLGGLKPYGVDIRPMPNMKLFLRHIDIVPETRDRVTWEQGQNHGVSSFEDLVCGNRLDRLPRKDLLELLDEDLLQEFLACLSDEQRQAVEIIRVQRANTSLLAGIAGSGKTMLIVLLLGFLMRQAARDETCFKAVIASPINSNADDLTEKCKGLLPKVKIIRLFTRSTEMSIFHVLAQQQQGKGLTDFFAHKGSKNPSNPSGPRTVGDMYTDGIDKATSQPLGIPDRRVTLAQWPNSVGYRMADRLRLVGDATRDFESTQDKQWRGVYDTWIASLDNDEEVLEVDEMSPQEEARAALDVMLSDLFASVLQQADVIVSTPVQVHQHCVALNIRPNMIFLDEATKTPTMDILGLYASYPCCDAFILAGDPLQTHTSANSPTWFNNFHQQLSFSLFERLIANGFPHPRLWVTQRFCRGICDHLSTLFTNNKMQYSVSFRFKPKHAGAYELLMNALPRGSPVLMVTVSSGQQISGPNKTRINKGTAAVDFDLVRAILNVADGNLTAEDIAIFTPYTGQRTVLERLRQSIVAHESNMHFPEHIDLKHLHIDSFDRSQGTQRFAVIADLTASETPGCLNDANRLFTGLSRAVGLLIIVCNAARLDAACRRDRHDGICRVLLDHTKRGNLRVPYSRDPKTLDLYSLIDSAPERAMHPLTEDADIVHEYVAKSFPLVGSLPPPSRDARSAGGVREEDSVDEGPSGSERNDGSESDGNERNSVARTLAGFIGYAPQL